MYSGKAIYNKYGNKRSAGFDSKRERARYEELILLQRAGRITDLKRQIRFDLIPSQYQNGKCIYRKVSYIADFTYLQDGKLVVEDVKGFKTPEYIIKKKLMYHVHGIVIKET